MRRTTCALTLLILFSGCMSFESGSGPRQGPGSGPGHTYGSCPGQYGATSGPPALANFQGPYGSPVPMAFPYSMSPPGNAYAAQQMMGANVPLNMMQMNGAGMPSGLQQAGYTPSGTNSGILLAQATAPGGPMTPPGLTPPGGMLTPPGMPFGPGMPGMQGALPGAAPGSGGMPGMPGAMPGAMAPGAMPPGTMPGLPLYPGVPGAVAAVGAMPNIPQGVNFPTSRTQVRFSQPVGMRVYWFTKGPTGKEEYSQSPIEVPGRYNFLQAAIYRLKLTNIPGNPGLEVYPTLEVVPVNPRSAEFLAHSSVPLSFTDEDFKQIRAGNYVVKVVYLPDPQYQDTAFMTPGELSSTQLEPGADPIEEARRRGSILLVVRMGNMDQQAPNSPRIDDPAGAAGSSPPLTGGTTMPPGAVPPNMMMPFGPDGRPINMTPPAPPGLPSHGPLIGNPGQIPSPGTANPSLPPLPPGVPGGAVPSNPATPPVGAGPSAPALPPGVPSLTPPSVPGLAPSAPMPPPPPVPPAPPAPPAKTGVSG